MRKRKNFSARSKAVVALRASLTEWRGERSICEITKNGMQSLITELGLAPYVPLTVWKKINGAAGEKKIGYGVKMLVYNHTVTQQTLFCGAKKENGAAGKKKLRGTAHLQAQRAKILRFHHSSHLGDLGVRGRGAPKSA